MDRAPSAEITDETAAAIGSSGSSRSSSKPFDGAKLESSERGLLAENDASSEAEIISKVRHAVVHCMYLLMTVCARERETERERESCVISDRCLIAIHRRYL
jgi:hypothetical protein